MREQTTETTTAMAKRKEKEERLGALARRIAPVAGYGAFSAVTLALALREGLVPVVVALGGSTLLYAVGWFSGEADILYLAWLDQGSNLLLLEVVSSAASVITVMITVVGILLFADFAHVVGVFGRCLAQRGLLWHLARRLSLIGAAACAVAVVGVSLSPVIEANTEQALIVAVLSITALVIVAATGTAER